MAFYLDTSAAVKLVVEEAETAALTAWINQSGVVLVASDLLRTELLRATRRAAPHAMTQARDVLDSILLLRIPPATFERAGELAPDLLRSLDSIHLAAALELDDELQGLITYDDRLANAARHHAINVITPT